MRQVLACLSLASAALAVDQAPLQEPSGGTTRQMENDGGEYTPLPRTPRGGQSGLLSSLLFSALGFEEDNRDVIHRSNAFVADMFASDFGEDVKELRRFDLLSKPTPTSKPEPGTYALEHSSIALGEGDGRGHFLRVQEHPPSKPKPPRRDGNSKPKPGPKSKPSPKSKPAPPNTRPLQGDHVILSEDDPVEYVYPASPYLADDYDTLRAELQLLSTPHAEDYMQAYYMALSTVKGECYDDILSYCTAPVFVSSLDDDSDDKDVLYSVVPDPNQFAVSNFVNTVFSMIFGTSDDLSNTNHVSDISEKPIPCDTGIQSDLATEKLPNNFLSSRMLSEADASSSESSEWSAARTAADYSDYLAPLGFGESGDLCLYAHYEMLSSGCKESISVVYEVHDQYVSEDEQSYHHGGLAALLLLVLLLSLSLRCCVKHCGRNAQKRMAEKSILKAIRADPSLKAQVESAAGHTLPEADQTSRCCWAMCLRVMVSALIVFVAVRITCAIVRDMVYIDEDGNEHEPSVIAVFLIMLAIVLLIVGFLRFCQYIYVVHLSGGSAERGRLIEASRRQVQNAFQWGHRFFIPRHPTDYAVLSSDEVDNVSHGSELISRNVSVRPAVVHGVPVAAFPIRQQTAGDTAPVQTYTNITML